MDAIRLLDLGFVPPVRSQSIYHALAHAMLPETPDSLVLVSPIDPYVCIGFHQDLEKEVDMAFCRAHGLPVYRREVGGGAVYLDRDQLFTQWVFHREHLPSSVEGRFALHVQALVDTYRALGIAAYHRPINDVHVDGRKIGGTGAARMGEAEVVVGSLMFDFDHEAMVRVLRLPSEKMRDKVYRSLREYVTTMSRELGRLPDREAVKGLYLDKLSALLGREIVPGALTEREEAAARRWDERLSSRRWLYLRGGLKRNGVKIHEGVQVVGAECKAPGGLIRVTASLRDGRIDDLTISGDFTMSPAAGLDALEEAVRGLELRPEALLPRLKGVYGELDLQSPGVTPEEIAAVLLALSEGHRGDDPG